MEISRVGQVAHVRLGVRHLVRRKELLAHKVIQSSEVCSELSQVQTLRCKMNCLLRMSHSVSTRFTARMSAPFCLASDHPSAFVATNAVFKHSG